MRYLPLLILLCAGCGDNLPVNVAARTSFGDHRTDDALLTVVHDNHWFVVQSRYTKGGILHHPSCPCGKTK